MFFPRRSGDPVQRFLVGRVALYFFAAGLWLAGASVGNTVLTGAAIFVALIAIVLGLIARRTGDRSPPL